MFRNIFKNPSSSSPVVAASSAAFRRFLATASSSAPSKSYKVVIVGAGSAGISVASQLARHPEFANGGSRELLVIDPSETHYYQPLWYVWCLFGSKRLLRSFIIAA
jgi:sulfide:quinone oxidoreductase